MCHKEPLLKVANSLNYGNIYCYKYFEIVIVMAPTAGLIIRSYSRTYSCSFTGAYWCSVVLAKQFYKGFLYLALRAVKNGVIHRG